MNTPTTPPVSPFPVTYLLRGSAKLDQQRKEIAALTKTMLGLVAFDTKLKADSKTEPLYFEVKDHTQWILWLHQNQTVCTLAGITYHYIQDGTDVYVPVPDHIDMHEVEKIHADLQTLVDAFVLTFPGISKDLKVLVDAGRP